MFGKTGNPGKERCIDDVLFQSSRAAESAHQQWISRAVAVELGPLESPVALVAARPSQ